MSDHPPTTNAATRRRPADAERSIVCIPNAAVESPSGNPDNSVPDTARQPAPSEPSPTQAAGPTRTAIPDAGRR